MFRTAFALALVFACPALAAEPFASAWAPSAKSRARLIADGEGGAGFQVELAPGAVTYWRDPGESGVPPTFDFSGSTNLAHADVVYPAPNRIAEPDGSEAFGYSGGVIFPIRVTAADPTKPVLLEAKVDYAVCEKICLPAKADVRLDVAKGAPSPEAPALAAARAAAPVATTAAAIGLSVTATGEKSWRLCLREAPHDLFLEAPEGYWIAPKREADGHCYALDLEQQPADAKFPIAARVTLTGGAPIEVAVSLAPKA